MSDQSDYSLLDITYLNICIVSSKIKRVYLQVVVEESTQTKMVRSCLPVGLAFTNATETAHGLYNHRSQVSTK